MVDIAELLTDIKELSEIPEFAGALYHKVEELKIALSENIEYHREIDSVINQSQSWEKGEIKGIRFELIRIGDSLWIPSIPNNQNNKHIYSIIPKPLIQYIVNQKVERGLIIMKKGLTLKSLKDRTFDLSFEKITEKYIVGLLSEHGNAKQLMNIPFSDMNGYEDININDLKLLIKYFKTYPYYFRNVFNNFRKVWKKVLDKRVPEKYVSGD